MYCHGPGKGPEDASGDFDFESSNQNFDKEAEMAKLSLTDGGNQIETPSPNQEAPAIQIKRYTKVRIVFRECLASM